MTPWLDPAEALIVGRWTRAAGVLPAEDLSTGEDFAEIPRCGAAEIDAAASGG